MQASAVRWGFSPDDVGLVTGNRRVNPNARTLVVAEFLLNHMLHANREPDLPDILLPVFLNVALQQKLRGARLEYKFSSF